MALKKVELGHHYPLSIVSVWVWTNVLQRWLTYHYHSSVEPPARKNIIPINLLPKSFMVVNMSMNSINQTVYEKSISSEQKNKVFSETRKAYHYLHDYLSLSFVMLFRVVGHIRVYLSSQNNTGIKHVQIYSSSITKATNGSQWPLNPCPVLTWGQSEFVTL